MTAPTAAEPDALKPFLTYSALTHAALAAAALALAGAGGPAPREVYRIDFIGPTAGIANRDPAAAPGGRPAPPARASSSIPPQAKAPEFARPRRPLPRPSILGPAEPERPAAAPAAAAPAAPVAPVRPAPAPAPGPADGEGSGANVSADLPNFPYPWYITQVRSQLWSRWSASMPAAAGEVVVMFSILRNGALTDLRVESSSGDDGYDYAAMSAVQEAAPFAPLPAAFREPFLKVHVRFTSQ